MRLDFRNTSVRLYREAAARRGYGYLCGNGMQRPMVLLGYWRLDWGERFSG